MSARQLIILAVALIAAIGAVLLVVGMNKRAPAQEAAAPIEGQQVLVVAKDVGQGAALTGDDLAWRLFPTESVGEQFITQTAHPEALTEMQNAVTRRPFAAGEPITMGSIVLPDNHGFMAAQLQPGFRAIAVEIDPATAAGGYIQPNDRVDVIVSTKVEVQTENDNHDEIRSSIMLSNIRVLALDEKTSPQTAGTEAERHEATVAVLEMSSSDARIFAQADRMGDITLALRGVENETGPAPSAFNEGSAMQQGPSSSGGVLIHSFGRVLGGSR